MKGIFSVSKQKFEICKISLLIGSFPEHPEQCIRTGVPPEPGHFAERSLLAARARWPPLGNRIRRQGANKTNQRIVPTAQLVLRPLAGRIGKAAAGGTYRRRSLHLDGRPVNQKAKNDKRQ